MTKPGFKDHFSGHADQYRQYRPGYPEDLFDYLAALTPSHELAWDCATGNGQAAMALARRFQQVVASDASEQQILQNTPRDNITYRVMPAEVTDLASASLDLVTVAQALHWFDLERFFAETERVLKPGGILAVWSYNLLCIDADVDARVNHLYGEILEPYWPPERRLVESNYRDIIFPFEKLSSPAFSMHSQWNLEQLLGYLRTWSATRAYMKENHADPVDALAESLAPLWQPADRRRAVEWPLTLVLCRK